MLRQSDWDRPLGFGPHFQWQRWNPGCLALVGRRILCRKSESRWADEIFFMIVFRDKKERILKLVVTEKDP